MPKEQPGFREHSPCAASIKNAKDKRNSTTLLAMRDNKDADHTSSRCSSEKDSGYSDSSDWQNTDVEDQQNSNNQPGVGESAETAQAGQIQKRGPGNPGDPALTSAGLEPPTIYIIENMVTRQPRTIQKRGQLLWRNKSSGTGCSDAPRLILCQQPILFPMSPQLQKPNLTGKKINDTYVPILNPYPCKAPHLGTKPPDKSSSNDKSPNLSKRVCTEDKSDTTDGLHKQPKLGASASGQPCSSSSRDLTPSSSSAASSCQGFPPVSSVHNLTTKGLHRNVSTSSRHCRFLNTVEILQQSGLLDITLRTKELLRQSTATDRDISQLRQHTELLCRTAGGLSGGLEGTAAWEHLHEAMAASSSYPDLKPLHNLQMPAHPDWSDANGPRAAEKLDVPQSRLLVRLLDPNQNSPVSQQSQSTQSREPEEKTFMPPDSSTG